MEQTSYLSAECVYRQKSPGIFILSKLITLPFSQPHSLTPSTCWPSPVRHLVSPPAHPYPIVMKNSIHLELPGEKIPSSGMAPIFPLEPLSPNGPPILF